MPSLPLHTLTHNPLHALMPPCPQDSFAQATALYEEDEEDEGPAQLYEKEKWQDGHGHWFIHDKETDPSSFIHGQDYQTHKIQVRDIKGKRRGDDMCCMGCGC